MKYHIFVSLLKKNIMLIWSYTLALNLLTKKTKQITVEAENIRQPSWYLSLVQLHLRLRGFKPSKKDNLFRFKMIHKCSV